jgi:calnexin
MQSDILFDNIYIGHSVDDAAKLKAETYDIKHPIEVKADEASKPKPSEKPASPMDLKFTDDPVLYVKEKWKLFLVLVQKDPIQAIKFVPEVAGGLGVLAITLIAIVIGSLGTSSAPPQAKKAAGKAKESATAAKNQAVDAASAGAEKVKDETHKRSARSAPAE